MSLGCIFLYAGSQPPDGYILCNGQDISTDTKYDNLKNLLNSNNAPNLKDAFIIGYDTDPSGNLPGNNSLYLNNIPSHTHSVGNLIMSQHSHGFVNKISGNFNTSANNGNGGNCFVANLATNDSKFQMKYSSVGSLSVSGNLGNSNDGNRERIDITNAYLVLNYIIKY